MFKVRNEGVSTNYMGYKKAGLQCCCSAILVIL